MSQKNILIFITDQLTWRALPCYGGEYARTPNIDSISEDSVMFDRCYTPCPLCQPARASFWSGRYPHEIDVLSNGRNWPVSPVPHDVPTLGETFKKAGYNTYHFGKRHDSDALRGFDCAPELEIEIPNENEAFPFNSDTYRDVYTTEKSVEFLNNYDFEKPLLMVSDFINPHNICRWVGDNAGVHEDKDGGYELPPLPENFDFDDIENRPKAVQYICCTHIRQAQTSGWTPKNYQNYLSAYYYYLEMVDKQIGQILDALKKRNKEDETLVIFMSDHGDSMVARGRVTKQVDFYEEVSRVPFIFKGKDLASKGKHIDDLASLLDLYPTLCGYAGIEIPKGLRGRDLSDLLFDKKIPKREFVASEWHTEWGYTVSPGRMIRNDRFKYTYYIEDKGEELYDLAQDPYEKVNLAKNPQYIRELNNMRKLLSKHLEETKDNFMELSWKADEKWRTHKLGYQNHEGIAAPQEK